MRFIRCFAVLVSISAVAGAEWTLSLTGNVQNESSAPVDGAQITALVRNESITTGSDGTFGATGIIRGNSAGFSRYDARIIKGNLLFTLSRSARVSVGLYTIQGRAISVMNKGILAPGPHTVALNTSLLSKQVYIMRFRIGNDVHCAKLLDGRRLGFEIGRTTARGAPARGMAKKGIWIDTLEVTHADYETKRVPIADYSTDVSITLLASGTTKPEITCPTSIRAYAYEKIRFEVEATDPDGNDVTLSLSDAPGSAVLENGVFTWQTSIYDTGGYEFSIKADDGSESISQPIKIDVVYETEADTCKRIKVLRPNGGEVFKVGDTMTIVWVTNEAGIYRGVRVSVLPDLMGAELYSFNEDEGIKNDNPEHYTGNLGVFHWEVSAEWQGLYGSVSMISDECVASIYGDYERERLMGAGECAGPSSGFARDYSDATFSIIE
ncbi:MAG: hypothetical protein GF350_13700 [Chitinivibrionales bacterium]|nr:hypothetical protein [Chitinivibrionales bacterium]